ncbi:MAG: Cache 3/Cache 2 fusion domain-containing protein, partial [Campylobacterales bacterium]|nr:Cache 3/Cache 2 fusion domain-containing protein [Campylobacterales bacterium]
MNKQEYIGRAKLFGKNYMTVYKPIIKNSEVIGILFIGYDFGNLYNFLEQSLANVKFGNSGYVYAFDATEGVLTVHPRLKGKKIYGITDADGSLIFEEMVKQKEGVRIYNWKEADGSVKEKIASFTYFKDWNIAIASSAYLDELLELNSSLRSYLIIGGLFTLFILILISYLIITKTVKSPLLTIENGLIEFFKYLNKDGKEAKIIELNSNDEFGTMAKAINENIEKIEQGIQKDNKTVEETIKIIEKAKQGYFDLTIKSNPHNP